ncbi:MAG: ARPP-1 family domain-containing protein, partial [bacterium]
VYAQYDSMSIFRNLKIIPVIRRDETFCYYEDSIQNWISLKSGMKKGIIQVSERGNYMVDNINVVIIENKSSKPLQIRSGEILVGGRQDRVFVKDTIIPAYSGLYT